MLPLQQAYAATGTSYACILLYILCHLLCTSIYYVTYFVHLYIAAAAAMHRHIHIIRHRYGHHARNTTVAAVTHTSRTRTDTHSSQLATVRGIHRRRPPPPRPPCHGRECGPERIVTDIADVADVASRRTLTSTSCYYFTPHLPHATTCQPTILFRNKKSAYLCG